MINLLEISKIPGLQGAGIESPVANPAPGTGGDAKPGFDSLVDLAMPQPVAIPHASGLPESGKTLPVAGGEMLPDVPDAVQAPPTVPLQPIPPTGGPERLTLPANPEPDTVTAGSEVRTAPQDIKSLVDRLATALAKTAAPDVVAKELAEPIISPGAAGVRDQLQSHVRTRPLQAPVLSETAYDVLRQIRAPSPILEQIAVRFTPARTTEVQTLPIQSHTSLADGASLLQTAPSPNLATALPMSNPAQVTPVQNPSTQPGQNTPHAFETLVDRLVEARESARPVRAEMSVGHDDFGRITLRMDSGSLAGGMRMALSSPDPDFAPVAQAALADRALSDRSPSDGDRPHADQARQDMQQRHNGEHARSGEFFDPQRQAEARAARSVQGFGQLHEDGEDDAAPHYDKPDERGLFV